MNQYPNELRRFKKIFVSTTLDKTKFAELFGFSLTMINLYLNGKADLQKISRRLVNLGFSADWLFTGKGEMLNKVVEVSDIALANELNIDDMNNRIIEWINSCFIDNEDFEKLSGIQFAVLKDCATNSKLITYSHIKKLKSSGLSYEWSVTGNGSKFEDNKAGRKLKNRYIKVLKRR